MWVYVLDSDGKVFCVCNAIRYISKHNTNCIIHLKERVFESIAFKNNGISAFWEIFYLLPNWDKSNAIFMELDVLFVVSIIGKTFNSIQHFPC